MAMNEHLEPIFNLFLPKLEENKIDYWVYGGISIAAFVGKFVRENKDVDVFIKETDFEKAKLLLDGLCKQNNSILKLKGNERPKIEIKVNSTERFSLIPIYQKDNIVVFKYGNRFGGNQKYPNRILKRVKRNISGYRFFTPQNEFIKEIFINHMKARPNKKNRPEFRTDAAAILTPEEYRKNMLEKED